MLNPSAGTKHTFRAWRLKGEPAPPVMVRDLQSIIVEADSPDDEADE